MITAAALLAIWMASIPVASGQNADAVPPAGNASPYKYVGNSFSHKFHRPSCPFAKQIWPARVQLFHFRKDAVAEGYSPCNYCLPAVWTSVHATIKKSAPPIADKSPTVVP
jgi:hypothetical protein